MKKSEVYLQLTGLLLAAVITVPLACRRPTISSNKLYTGSAVNLPVLLADGSPIPWPKKPSGPGGAVGSMGRDGARAKAYVQVADGSPIPWPKPTQKPGGVLSTISA